VREKVENGRTQPQRPNIKISDSRNKKQEGKGKCWEKEKKSPFTQPKQGGFSESLTCSEKTRKFHWEELDDVKKRGKKRLLWEHPFGKLFGEGGLQTAESGVR